jgi:hypothetical protein
VADGEKQLSRQVFTRRLYPPCEPSVVVGKLGPFWPWPPNLQLGSGCGMEQLPTSGISDGPGRAHTLQQPERRPSPKAAQGPYPLLPAPKRPMPDLHVRAGHKDSLAVAARTRGSHSGAAAGVGAPVASPSSPRRFCVSAQGPVSLALVQ